MTISTRAPREGSDSVFPARGMLLDYFYPRSPRGARRRLSRRRLIRRSISTRAPREGSDIRPKIQPRKIAQLLPALPARGATAGYGPAAGPDFDFYPRSPRGERRAVTRAIPAGWAFLPALPARGATACASVGGRSATISTRAPREGSDQMAGLQR